MDAPARAEVERLADQHAALRRVATLVAHGAPASELYSAVAEEAARLLGVSAVLLGRFEADRSVTIVASRNEPGFAVGSTWPLDGPSVGAAVHDTGRPARIDDYSSLAGSIAASVRESSIRSTVGVPIPVDGEVWGVLTVATDNGPSLPTDMEDRLAEFAELVATGISNASSRDRLQLLADEQAALGRVATLVASGAPPTEVFAAVTEEVGRLFSSDFTYVTRYDSEEAVTVLAGWMPEGELPMTLPGRWSAGASSRAMLDARAPVRLDPYPRRDLVEDPETAVVLAPITVEGVLWGFMTVASTTADRPPPPGTEERLSSFTELVATAISNAESQAALAQLADEQASLRRVATLVAEGVPAHELFSAVTTEVAHVFSSSESPVLATVIRFDPGPECVLVGTSRPYPAEAVGARWAPRELYVSTRVLRTAASSRVDESDLKSVGGPDADVLRLRGFLHQVGSPVVVEGRLWGAITLNSRERLPSDIDRRLTGFTELVATAIANVESKTELAASRRRMVAAADDARRRIERNLHDGIQQQLVSIGMELGAVEDSLPADDDLRLQVAAVSGGLRSAIDDLREISRGIHPAILSHGGLGPALKTLARRSPVPVRLTSTVDGRLPEGVEVAAYYVVSEALTNVAKHAEASVVTVDVARNDGRLELSIRDDGVGGAEARGGTGLIGLKDRVEALGGRIDVESVPGRGTSLEVSLPVGADAPLDT